MTNQNELQNDMNTVDNQIADKIQGYQIAAEKQGYQITQDNEGKFQRKAIYNDYCSVQAASRVDKIWLFNLLEGNLDEVYGMKDNIGKTIEIAHIITKAYDSIDEQTGEIQYGVLTYLIDPENNAYVTSSKNVYFSVERIMQVFGTPTDYDWQNVKVQIDSERTQNGNMIKVKMVG